MQCLVFRAGVSYTSVRNDVRRNIPSIFGAKGRQDLVDAAKRELTHSLLENEGENVPVHRKGLERFVKRFVMNNNASHVVRHARSNERHKGSFLQEEVGIYSSLRLQ